MAVTRCTVCSKTFDSEQSLAMPFCGPRCRLIDLKRWLGEEYGLPYESEERPQQPQEESEPEG